MYYAQDSRIHLNVEGGKGGGNGIGGAGGIKPTVLKGTPNRVFSLAVRITRSFIVLRLQAILAPAAYKAKVEMVWFL